MECSLICEFLYYTGFKVHFIIKVHFYSAFMYAFSHGVSPLG